MATLRGDYYYFHFADKETEAQDRMLFAHHFHFISGSWQVGVTQGPKRNMVAPRTPNIRYVRSSVICFNVTYIIHTYGLKPV